MTSPNMDVDSLLDRHRDRFRRLIRAIVAEEEGEDPFRVPSSRYLELRDDERFALVRRATAIAWDRVERELSSRGAAWVVLVGDEVVAESADPTSVPTPDEVLEMGKAKGRVAYLFTAELLEELEPVSTWTPLRGTDRYPTIPLRLLVADPLVVVADLDTGAHVTLLDWELTGASTRLWLSGRHLGRPFYWSPARVEIELRTTSETMLRRSVAVWQVRDWSGSPFVRINPSRRMLVGRDLLRAFGLRLVLRASEGETEVTG
jgi:hypothetical protein